MDRATKIMSIIAICLIAVVLYMWKFEIGNAGRLFETSFWIDIISLPEWVKVR